MIYNLKKKSTALIIISALCFLFTTTAQADSFYLKEESTNVIHGPFKFSHKAKVKIDDKSYVLLKKTSGKTLTVHQKLQQTIIPDIKFRSASIHDVLEYLRQASITYSPPMEESKKGVNIILNPKARSNRSTVTFSAKRISLEEVLRAVTNTSGLKTRIERNVIWVLPKK